MKDIRDWCISRQLWWGHRIPAWYDDKGKVYVGASEKKVRTKYKLNNSIKLEQDTDVLDTWFSSQLWTFVTLGWPKKTIHLKNFILLCSCNWIRHNFLLGCENDYDFSEISKKVPLKKFIYMDLLEMVKAKKCLNLKVIF